MIYHLYPLPRDPLTRTLRFGYSSVVGFSHCYDQISGFAAHLRSGPVVCGWSNTLTVGLQLETPDVRPIELDVWKSVELHRTRDHQPVFLERLFLRDGDALIPFRLRFRQARRPIRMVVHLRNLEQIHRRISGHDSAYSLVDPRCFYIAQAFENATLPLVMEERLCDLTQLLARNNMAGLYARHCASAAAVRYDLDALTAYLNQGPDPLTRRSRIDPEVLLARYIHPDLPVIDELMRIQPVGEISFGRLGPRFGGVLPTSVQVTPELPLEHPNETQFSPAWAEDTAAFLEEVQATDLKLRYTLSNGCVVPGSEQISLLVDRYAGHLPYDADADLRLVRHLLQHARSSMLRHGGVTPEVAEALCSDVVFQLEKNYNDEALLTLYRHSEVGLGRPLLVVHFDFALLALCSQGVGELAPLPAPARRRWQAA